MKKKLVIVGGGYAGLILINEIKNDFDIVLIDRNDYHIEQTEIHRYLGEKITLDELVFSYEDIAKNKNFTFKKGNVDNLDFDKKVVTIDGKEEVNYDYLVLATGSQTFFPRQIEDLNKYKLDIKNLDELKSFKSKLDELIKTQEENKNIVIAGGGLSGVEIAMEIAQLIEEKAVRKDIKVHLVEQQPTVLPGQHEFLINETTKILDKLGINRVHNEFISKVEEDKILLANGQEIPYDLSLFVLGVSSEKISNNQEIPFNVKNQFQVNEYFQLDEYKDVFCVGDFAETKNSKGNYNPPTAQLAIKQAQILAKNLKNVLNNKSLESEITEIKGVLLDLNYKNAAGMVFNFKLRGLVAYLLKRFTSYLYKTRIS